MTILDTDPARHATSETFGSYRPDKMVYAAARFEQSVQVSGTRDRGPSFCDDENASFANDLVINLAIGKLNQPSRRDTLCRNVLLQNILNERVHEREVGIQCYGNIRMHEVRVMVARERRLSGIREEPRTWDDVDEAGDENMEMDNFMHLNTPQDQQLLEQTITPHSNSYGDDQDGVVCRSGSLDEGTIENIEDGEDSSTDEDEIDEVSVDGALSPMCPDITLSQPDRSPMRIKLVLRRAETMQNANSSCGDDATSEQRPRLKRKRNVGADLTNNKKTNATDRCLAACGKRSRYNTQQSQQPQDWSSMRGLSPVC